MNLRFLDAFMWIVRLQSFRATAEHLNLSQAAVSSRIATLEDQFGCELFDRKSRDLRLTPSGKILARYAEQMLAMQEEMRTAIGAGGVAVGSVRIGVVETVVHTILVGLLQALDAGHPGIAFEVTSEPTAVLHDLLKRGSIDLAIHTAPLREAPFANEQLCTLVMGWVRRQSDGRDVRLRDIHDLAQQAIITFPKGSPPHNAVLDLFKDASLSPRIHCITSMAAIMRLAHAGMGIASMPLAAVQEEVTTNVVTIVAPKIALPDLPLFVSYRASPQDRVINLVMDIVRQETARFCNRVGPRFAKLGIR